MDNSISVAKSAVFKPSEEVQSDEVCGFSFSGDSPSTSLSALLESFRTTGFQATNIGRSIEIVTDMLKTTLEPVQLDDNLKHFDINRESRPKSGCTIFLGFTSNLMSSGLRETFRFLVQHNLVDCIVTTAGGIEEDFIKCLAPTYIGDFELDGADLRKRGLNRIGNLIVPNNNYCKFEDWVLPIFDEMLEEQNRDGIVWTPSLLIRKLGQKIDNERSVYYWAARNKIPVFCPALTDGSIGDMLYFHSYKNPGLVVDILRDVRTINDMAVGSVKTGMIILGGGVVKHHICNANLMRNGADHTVFINTGQEFDGSDSGARPDEAVSWGKIKPDSKCVKVFCDATVAFPLIVAETFAKHVYEKNKKK